ncbi:MBL fold metallo-hydrolase [uncultured Roseovarius sp.]|uniref:MBL fold metallo-hydrolase n=1 Tax=uncultured Roseovarius sp. TaxID=293344 RepID=UPI0026088054|nr:MBL fold metallo-hydrolase [uncultured Roseovarius sp.]
MTTSNLTRRSLIASSAALPLIPLAQSANAAAPMLGPSTTKYNRFMLGNFEVTTLLSNSFPRPDPHSIFGLNVGAEEFAQVSEAANLPTDQARFFFTPTVVNTGSELVLFDTGLSSTDITSALAAAGYSPDQIDIVVITHMHGDHIGGLMRDGTATFPKARYITGAVEYDAWVAMENEKFNSNMKPLADKAEMIDPGNSAAPGITAVEAFGHTPGHMTYMIESNGQQLLIAADFANHYVWSLAHPEWEVKFDMDKQAAATTRVRLLDMMAADRIPFVGYHMPWPAVGYVEKHGKGYVYTPESYQLSL